MRFDRRLGVLVAISAWGLLVSSALPAQDQADPERGRALANTCLGCHGIPNYKNAYPNYSVPKLEGQHPEYIVSALQGYRNRDRSHLTMHAQASSLSDQDMRDVAAYFTREPLKPDASPEGKVPETAQVCVACHGEDGVGITPLYPTLSGQHADYLARALTEYKKGGRKNPVMKTFAEHLSAEQIEELANYYAAQRPALKTEERPSTRYSAGH
jgi:cytochrome c553